MGRKLWMGARTLLCARSTWLVFGLALFGLIVLPSAARSEVVPLAVLPRPENISCQGYQRDTVRVFWQDTATDETNYRIERSVGGAAFTEVDTRSLNSDGYYDPYNDTGADVSSQNRRYRIRAYRSSDNSYSPYSEICNNRRIAETTNFRLFYGLRGTSDDCPLIDGQQVCLADTNVGGANTFVALQGSALQGSVDAFRRVGFLRDAGQAPGSLDKIPVNVVWCDGGGCAGGGALGLSPLLMETPFNVATRVGDPVAYMVALHEAFHFQQFKYPGLDDPDSGWVIEGQARSIQDKFCIGSNTSTCLSFDDIDTGYAGYVGQVNGYLNNPITSINRASYGAALFWTYLLEKYGTGTTGVPNEAGVKFLERFWESAAATPGRDGIAVINSTLQELGHTERFRDIWKDFAVANYAKDLSGPGVPAKYRYADMQQPGGTYAPVMLSVSQSLGAGQQVVDTDESVNPWSARYYEVRPSASLPVIDIKVTQDSTTPLYYTILGIKGTNIALEENVEARHLDRTLLNDGYDRVVLIVAGLENLANYRLSLNGTQPTLRILTPTTGNKARVGSPTAPDKFRVTLEVVDADGVPLAGINLANFSFQVGTQSVPAANILTSATVQGQQWFVLRAPAQTATGTYTLVVRYGTILMATEVSAVDYTPRNDADSVLVIDRSGSMADFGKLAAAQTGARLFVDSWRSGDKIGVVSFSDSATADMGLQDWTDTPSGGSRQTAFTAIDALIPAGGTALGDGLRRGWDIVKASSTTAHDWAVVFLSDGLETSGTETFDTVVNALVDTTVKKPVIHTVAVGPDADRLRMQQAAERSGGTYQYVSAPASPLTGVSPQAIDDLRLNMDARYRAIATEIVGQEQFFSQLGPVEDGDGSRDTVLIPVDGSAATMVLSLSWNDLQRPFSALVLSAPDGSEVAPFQRSTRHIVWRVPTPQAGTWKLVLFFGKNQTPEGAAQPEQSTKPTFLVQGSLRSDVNLDLYLTTPLAERTPGVPMHFVASLTDTGPIKAATVVADVQLPSGASVAVALRDDGLHGDGAADDGLYGGTLYQTGQPGSYTVSAQATGVSSLSGNFTRQALVSFHLNSSGDRDQDGLPDEWEIRYGTDPKTPDFKDDPDQDGVPNGREWERGTDPRDPDTDDGGESDGTDKDPFDPSDDGIEPTYPVAYPGNGKIHIRYVLRRAYVAVDILRAAKPAGPYTLLQRIQQLDGVFTDEQVRNEIPYCYLVRPIDGNGRVAAAVTPSCTTPKTDPLPPHGWVTINQGARATVGPDVVLQLWASDAVDPESEYPGDKKFLPPADSASGVTEMIISNNADMRGAVYEPYAQSKPWKLAKVSGLATVFVKFRDAAGNESEVFPATINVGRGPGLRSVFLPFVRR